MTKRDAMQRITAATNAVQAVERMLSGRAHLVLPVVLLVEGVHNGLYYPADMLAELPDSWNGVPLTDGHPERDGTFLSANSPDVLEDFGVGRVFGVYWDEDTRKLRGEMWLDIESARLVNPKLLAMVRRGDALEISTGLWTTEQAQRGEWNGEQYRAVVIDMHPDHLALLPDDIGACSWQDGCGVRANRGDDLSANFVGSPRNKYGTHASKGFKGGMSAYRRAWRLHFSQVGGGALSAKASGPIRGTVRRTEMIAASMKPACSLPGTERIGARTGPKSPLSGDYPEKPSDYGLSRWARPSDDDLTQEDVQLSCTDLKIIKRAALAEIKRRAKDREAQERQNQGGSTMWTAFTRFARTLFRGNEISFDEIREQLQNLVNAMDSNEYVHWVKDVFEDSFVYGAWERNGGGHMLYRRDYAVDADTGEVSMGEDDPIEVREERTYVPVTNEDAGELSTMQRSPLVRADDFVRYIATNEKTCDCHAADGSGSGAGNVGTPSKEERQMKKKAEQVAALIANEKTRFTEKDKPWLEGLSEDQLASLEPIDETPATPATPAAQPAPKANAETKADAPAPKQPTEPMTVEQFVANAPEAFREPLQQLLEDSKTRKETLVQQLSANERCPFSEDELTAKPLAELEKLSRWAGPQVVDYSALGAGFAGNAEQGGEDESMMEPPDPYAQHTKADTK